MAITGAIFNSLIYGGVDSADYGVYITGDAVFNAPKRSVELVSVPGRNGAIEIDQGHFENIEVSYPAGMFGDDQTDFRERLSDFRNAIMSQKGYQRLSDTYHPDEYRMGIYVDGLDVEPTHYNEAGQFKLKFNCKPQRWLTSGEEPIDVMEWGETETVSGDIVTFEADETTGIKSALVEFSARQDGTPWISGLEQTPYLLRQSPQLGNSYNSEMDTLIGGSIAWNQLVQNGNFADTSGWSIGGPTKITFSVNNNIGIVEKIAGGGYPSLYQDIKTIPKGHKIFFSLETSASTQITGTYLLCFFGKGSASVSPYVSVTYGTSWAKQSTILNFANDDVDRINILYSDPSTNWSIGDKMYARNVQVIDLTATFGTEIADYVYGLEQATSGSGIAWLKGYGFLTKDYYAYNNGSLVSVKTSEHRTTGKNLLPNLNGDSVTINGLTFTKNSDGSVTVNGTNINSWTTSYWFGVTEDGLNTTFPEGEYILTGSPSGGGTSSNFTWFMSLYYGNNAGNNWGIFDFGDGVTYSLTNGRNTGIGCRIGIGGGKTVNNITFYPMLRRVGTDSTYEPYTAHSYPLGNDDLRGLFKLSNGNLYADGDVKTSDGKIARKYGKLVIDGSTGWFADGSERFATGFTSLPDGLPKINNPDTSSNLVNAVSNLFIVSTQGGATQYSGKFAMSKWGSTYYIYFAKGDFADAIAFKNWVTDHNIEVVYELATPTTEQSTPFASPQIVSPYGTEEYVDTRDVPVPVGHRTSYADAYSINGRDEINVYVSPTQDEEDAEIHTFEFGLTYYGGDVNYISGKVKENKVRIVAHEIKNHYYDFTPATHIYDVRLTGSFNGKISSGSTVPNPTNALCNIMDISASGVEMDLFDGSSVRAGMYHDSSFNYTRLRIVMPQNITTKAEAEAWLDSSNIEIVYDRYEPVEDQHIPESFLPIQGQNYIWADSGDVTIEYGMMPGYIINPTRFDVRPLLMVEGDGALEVNGYDVFLRNSVLGRVVIEPAGSITKPSFYTYRSQVSHIFQNKPISFEVGDIISYGKVTYSARIITTILGNVNSVTFTPLDNFVGTVAAINYMGLTPMGYHRYEVHVDVAYQYDIGEIASGSSESGSVQAQYEISFSASGLATETLTFKYEGFPGEDDAQNLKLEMKVEDAGGAYNGDINTITWSYGDFVAESTKPTLGHPAYIDCELGEAYMIESGEVISLNSAVDLGSDLPTLSPGVNKITRSFTITGLEIEPRWWKV